MQLKTYQQDALESVGRYFSGCLKKDVAAAFADEQPFAYKVPSEHEALRDIPYVCVRIPTGGGKTLLASHSIERVAKAYLSCDFPVALWLVPGKTIKSQTAEALKNPKHPYRMALDKVFNRQVMVIETEEFTLLRPQDFGNKAVIVVSTLQNFRVEKEDGRKIYAFNEHLAPHFARLPSDVLATLETVKPTDLQEHGLQAKQLGKTKHSFANLLKAYRPFVIVDEAHNARTPLTFDVLANLLPSAILEFTATPNVDARCGSNVLYHVGANVLKKEEMIKLPIILTEHETWQQAVDGAYLRRSELAQKAQHESDYVRPIVLFQAEAKNGAVTVEVLKRYLLEELKIDEREIAVVTGSQRELDKVDLYDKNCPILYIITVEALKEGWDCPFAYVFCSVQNVSSSKEAEQLLGRVLRMPYAKRRKMEDLNRAYAHLSSKSFGETAKNLQDKLIGMGFETLEVADMLRMGQTGQDNLFDEHELPVFQTAYVPTVLELDRLPENLTSDEQSQLIATEQDGRFLVQVSGNLSDNLQSAILKTATGKKQTLLKQQIAIHQAKIAKSASPAEQGRIFAAIPQLCVNIQGELMLADPDILLDYRGWHLLDYPARLEKFRVQTGSDSFAVDIDGDKLTQRFYGQQLHLTDDWLDLSQNDFIRWLDNHVRVSDIPQAVMLAFLQRLTDDLLAKPNVSLADLLQQKFALARDIQALIQGYRQKAVADCYQQSLFGGNDVQACLDAQHQFCFDLKHYAPQPPFYSGNYRFNKSYFAQIEDLKSSGEELDCAKVIDSLPQVKHWVRNPVKRGFGLPLAKDNFYPDFIAELTDGRILVVEYKGEPYKTNDDSKEKCLIAERWAKLSGGQCLFIMAVKQDEQGRDVREQLLDTVA
ncbi:DEAD/DEAH box helicase [Neisseria animalis]|nr:DEAD/DEAH box helicase family protein [Neisseria animalis]VEE06068.1 type III restriction-modification system StyLTI enzyme res [Neisseria animalis]